MGKGKPRHNSDKRQNKISKWCPYAEWDSDDNLMTYGECGYKTDKCQGIKFNCSKGKYKREQIKRTK